MSITSLDDYRPSKLNIMACGNCDGEEFLLVVHPQDPRPGTRRLLCATCRKYADGKQVVALEERP